jgi:ketopantoate reductase
MSKNILILGAGAIGSCVAANFSQANIRHLIVDPWPDLITKVQGHGLQITMQKNPDIFNGYLHIQVLNITL